MHDHMACPLSVTGHCGEIPAAACLTTRLTPLPSVLASSMLPGPFADLLLPCCSPQAFSRSIVFLLDRSGSMTGKPLQYARQALDRALTDLGPGDQLNIIAYDHEQVRGRASTVTPYTVHGVRPSACESVDCQAGLIWIDMPSLRRRPLPSPLSMSKTACVQAATEMLRCLARRYAGARVYKWYVRRPSRRQGGGCEARTWTRAA